MNAARELEGRYRRLLALYPAGHRARHEEEMLGVLMTAAPAGQRRPQLAESAALIRGAARIWLRPGRGPAFQHWQDGLAAVSVLLPLLLATYWAIGQLDGLATPSPNPQVSHALAYSAARTTGPWLIVAVLVLFRLRWPAVVVAAAALIATTLGTATALNLDFISPPSMLYAVGLGLEITALVASPGPRRGQTILHWKHYVLAGLVVVVIAWVSNWLWLAHQAVSDAIITAMVTAGLALLAASGPYGRRSAALLLIPGYYLALGFLVEPSMTGASTGNSGVSGWEGLPRIMLTCAPLAIAVSVAITMAVRYIRRPLPTAHQPPDQMLS
jgi:hypothetical protein